jgi:deoxycytidylate deaminase
MLMSTFVCHKKKLARSECRDSCVGYISLQGVTHELMAEIEALIFAGQDAQGCVMLVTHSPCKECAKAIICAGIKIVIYNEQHGAQEDFDFVKELFEDTGIVLEKLEV